MRYKKHCGKCQAKETQSMKNAVTSMKRKPNEETEADSTELNF